MRWHLASQSFVGITIVVTPAGGRLVPRDVRQQIAEPVIRTVLVTATAAGAATASGVSAFVVRRFVALAHASSSLALVGT